jgi:hypothetical protein
MGAIRDYSSGKGGAFCGRLSRDGGTQEKAFHLRGTEKGAMAEKLSIAKEYTVEAKLLTAMTI